MNSPGNRAGRYATLASAVAVVSLLLAWLVSPSGVRDMAGWLALGWGLMAAIHVAAGSRLVALHGTAGSGFFLTLGVGMACRLIAAAAGAAGAVFAGEHAAWAYVAGLAAGFVPLQVYEMTWFMLAGRGDSERARS